jgi:chaperonin GroEL
MAEDVVLINKTMIYSHDARKSLQQGMCVLSKAVGLTLGPQGKNVILGRKLDLPHVVNDGVTIAKEIEIQNQLENIGILLMRQAALKTNDIVGDGTTTSTVLAHAIIQEGLKSISAGANPILIKKGIEKSVQFVVKKIAEKSCPIVDIKDIVRVASISAGNNNEIGYIIASAILKVGKDGVLSIEEGESTTTSLQITEGMSFDKGYFSSSFLSNSTQLEICQDNPWVLLTDQKITKVEEELIPLLEQVAITNRPLIIMAEEITQEALSTLIINRLKGIIDVVAVRIPGLGDRRKSVLEDIAVLTNTSVVSKDTGLSLDQLSINNLGSAKRVIISKNKTTILVSDKNQKMSNHCINLRKQIEFSNNIYEKNFLRERLAKLAGGIAVIKVGAATTTEMYEQKLRLEDAVNATKAAIEEGIIPGGGSTLAHLSKDLDMWSSSCLLGDELLGAYILVKALLVPLKTIVENTGYHGSLVLERLRLSSFEIGYDANSDKMVNMYQAGIVDPAKVTRLSLQNASSIASVILTTECIVSDRLVHINL